MQDNRCSSLTIDWFVFFLFLYLLLQLTMFIVCFCYMFFILEMLLLWWGGMLISFMGTMHICKFFSIYVPIYELIKQFLFRIPYYENISSLLANPYTWYLLDTESPPRSVLSPSLSALQMQQVKSLADGMCTGHLQIIL